MLGSVCENRDNGFNFLRLLAATGILIAHCTLVIPSEGASVMNPHADIRFAVDLLLALFFVFSGFLITASLERNPNMLRYCVARGLRIFPGLIVVSLILSLGLGVFFTTLPIGQYFLSVSTWTYTFTSALALDASATLPGVFVTNPVQSILNMPIWTLRYEIVLYVGFPILYLTVLNRSAMLRLATILFLFAAFAATKIIPALSLQHDGLINLANFGVSFLIGASLWIYKDHIPHSVSMLFLTWAVFIASLHLEIAFLFGALAAGYTFIWVAFLNISLLKNYNRVGDYSYGIYIIHFPVAQALYTLSPGMDGRTLTAFTFPMTLLFAMALWRYVEKPSFGMVKPVEARLAALWGTMVGVSQRTSRQA